jgi:hypothetical protein
MKSSHENDLKEKIGFLKRTVPFVDWSIGLLKAIAQEAKWVTFQIGDEICTEGTYSEHVLFLKKGACKVYANYEMDREKGRVKIGQVEVLLIILNKLAIRIFWIRGCLCQGREITVYSYSELQGYKLHGNLYR